MYYFGFKYAGYIFDQYRISLNNDLIQTQNHSKYEWFMQYNSLSDEPKKNRDLYATLMKIREMTPFLSGVYVDLKNIEGQKPVDVHLKIRILDSAFLMLYKFKVLSK